MFNIKLGWINEAEEEVEKDRKCKESKSLEIQAKKPKNPRSLSRTSSKTIQNESLRPSRS